MLQRLPIAPAQAKDKSQNVLFEVHKKNYLFIVSIKRNDEKSV